MYKFTFLQLSSLNKIFLDENYSALTEMTGIKALKGERVSYQILYVGGREKSNVVKCNVTADKRFDLQVRRVGNVPVTMPINSDSTDEFYLRKTPGLYPDVLYPLENNKIEVKQDNCHSLFITVQIPCDIDAGSYPIKAEFEYEGKKITKIFEITVLDELLPKQKLTYTQWFHSDCIASYYGYEIFSDEHWDMIEKFIEKAAYSGINMILTPIFTPPLDTEVGLERPTVQLVDVEFSDNEYTFGFSKLKKWLDICKKYGIDKFEMSHLFTQWGTGCTPKIEAKTSDGIKKIFGWHVKADTDEYRNFLNAFLPELTEFLEKEKVYENTYFHVSDEPDFERHFEIYKTEREMLNSLIPSEKIMDAMSHYEFCEAGLADMPVVITSSIDKFFEMGKKDIWAYTCCVPSGNGYSNRFISMPSGRNRITGFQLYKYGINGYLHWGYNFYYSQLSRRKINPFNDTCADEAFPGGDSFSVYPGENGPLDSIRSEVFYEAIQDISACKLLEKYIGRDEVLKIIEQDEEITWNSYSRIDSKVLYIRNNINNRIEKETEKSK